MAFSSVKVVAVGVLFLAFAAQAAKEEVTPMQSVISLLGGLSEKIAAEGAKEAAQYDKFSCFCKEQATEKQLAIDKSKKTISKNGATATQLSAKIQQLSNEVGGFSMSISTETGSISTKTTERQTSHELYLQEAADVAQAVADCDNAVAAIEKHLGKLKKDSQRPGGAASLLQVQLEKNTAAATVLSLLKDASSAPKLGYDATYSIITSMKEFSADFKKQAAKIDSDEGKDKYVSDSAILLLQNELAFSNKAKHQAQEQINRQSADLESNNEEKTQADKDMTSDSTFMAELATGCQQKAALFDQRSNTRSGELTAIATAIEKLKEGAPPGGAVGKMAELEKGVGHVVKRHIKPASFLQISREAGQVAAVKKARSFLAEAVANSDSVALSSLTVRMQVAGDHFVKVRRLVQDMISKLEADASREATKKGFCDKGIKDGTDARDDSAMQIEDRNSQIAKTTARSGALEEGIATATKELAELSKAILEATELRAEEKKNNLNTIELATVAAQGVDMALEVLHNFYDGQSSLLQDRKYTPANGDREGKTVKDRAPEVFQAEYKGAKNEAHGILGMLDVCKSDFEGVKRQTGVDEETADEEFQTFKTETETSVETKEGIKSTKEGELKEAKASIVELKGELDMANGRQATALESLDSMRTLCDLNGEPAENREKQRLAEIESLKDAVDILDNWKGD